MFTTMPASLRVYENNTEHSVKTLENIRQLVRGWVASPMVQFEGFGQKRLDIFDTMHKLQTVVEFAAWQSDDEIEEAVQEFVTFHKDAKEALSHLKYVFQGYTGSVAVEQAGDALNRASVAGSYYELETVTKDLFAVA